MTRTYSWCSKRCTASSLYVLRYKSRWAEREKKSFDYMASDLCQPIMDNAQHVLVWWCANQLQSALLLRWLVKLVESFNQQNVSLKLPGLDSISHLSSTCFFCHSFLFCIPRMIAVYVLLPTDEKKKSIIILFWTCRQQQQEQQQQQQQNIFAPPQTGWRHNNTHNLSFLYNKKLKNHSLEPLRGLIILGPY